MTRRGHFSVFAALAVLLASLFALPAHARGSAAEALSIAPVCHASSGLDKTFTQMAASSKSGDLWKCSNEKLVAHEPLAWLLFERESWQGQEHPRYFFSRIARHRSIAFATVDADGTMRTEKWDERDARPFAAGPVFQLKLPEITDQTTALLVRIERPHSIPLLTEARVTNDPEEADWTQIEVLTLAFVIGMLVLPLLFDISFFIVLRERFVLLHAAMVVAMITYVMFAGGLISVFGVFSLSSIAIVSALSWAIGCGISALFLAEFLEDGAQSQFMKTLTIGVGFWSICVPGFFALQLHATQAFDDQLYFVGFIPVIVLITAAIAEAVGRGSRSARFIAVAWAPIILSSIERLVRGLGLHVGPSSLDQTLYIATGLEVIVISLAIADRFLAIRRERDEAVTEARMLEQLSERDELTGLLNRRGLESQYDEFFRRGFHTFALIDLDRFKQVNDMHGHQKGDAALVACALALRNNHDPDLMAARLGGEEFVVLLRGDNSVQRAEALRQAIPMRIAATIEGLKNPVTASMGVVEIPHAGTAMMQFAELYARADTLMYEAKASGRNRMVYERLTLFASPSTQHAAHRAFRAGPEPANAPNQRRRRRSA